MRFIDQMDLAHKRLLLRVDFNVPLDGGRITDDNRIRQSMPTINFALEKGASLILAAHLGKPKGVVVPALSLAPVAEHLSSLLGRPVRLAPDCIGPEVQALAKALRPGEVLMLENLRFHAEETGKTPEQRGDFGKQLAELADVYVGDAFGVVHRQNASVVDAPHYAKACCAGLLMKREWEYLVETLAHPKRPFVAVSGGAKVSSKLGVLQNLLDKVDDILIGGAMANTFLLAQGYSVGRSLAEPDLAEAAAKILASAAGKGTRLHLPVDLVLGRGKEDREPLGVCLPGEVPAEAMILDIGPASVERFGSVLKGAGTVVWNGPMGFFENPAFAQGSLRLCRIMAGLDKTVTMVGGGDTDAVVHQSGLTQAFDFISTGGGSFLEFMEGKELPGITALKECAR